MNAFENYKLEKPKPKEKTKYDILAEDIKKLYGGSGYGLLTKIVKEGPTLAEVRQKFEKCKKEGKKVNYFINCF